MRDLLEGWRALAAGVCHEALDWDALDVAASAAWAALPPALLVALLRAWAW